SMIGARILDAALRALKKTDARIPIRAAACESGLRELASVSLRRRRERYRPLAAGDIHLAATAPGEFAIGEAEAGNGTAEAALADLFEVEARLDRQAPHRGADPLAPHLQRAGRHARVAHRTVAANLDGADHGPVGMHPPPAARAL